MVQCAVNPLQKIHKMAKYFQRLVVSQVQLPREGGHYFLPPCVLEAGSRQKFRDWITPRI
jgi:hypothetical protein